MTLFHATANGNVQFTDDEVAEWQLEQAKIAASEPARIAKEASDAAIAELAALDLKSVRSLREWVSAQSTAPKTLTDLEKQVVDTRKRVVKG